MVPAAAPSPDAQVAIERFLFQGRKQLRQALLSFMERLDRASQSVRSAELAHRHFTALKLRFNAVLYHFDMFAEAVVQRSQARSGVWLAGLDYAARDAMRLPGSEPLPPVVCFLARDPGGAIRRVKSRLPGGEECPITLIRIPRERMVGSGIASSLVHEVGHQVAELVQVLDALRASVLQWAKRRPARVRGCWSAFAAWISEIFSDVWGVSRVGVTSTLGLIGLVSLPRALVFRANHADPHPTPWLRVLISCAFGHALYPDPQWRALESAWERFYPLRGLPAARRSELRRFRSEIPRLVSAVLRHVPTRLGKPLDAVLRFRDRNPAQLRRHFLRYRRSPDTLRSHDPSAAFALLGQARADGRLSAEAESKALGDLLEHWALRGALRRARLCTDALGDEPAQPCSRINTEVSPIAPRPGEAQ
jgi:hypothetical protein